MSKKILLVEDEFYLAELYKMKFEHEGYTVVWAPDGEEGLAMAKKEQPDLVLLDIIMPRLNGYEVLNALRSDEATKHLKIFMLSNLGQNDEIKSALSKGADGYFVKANLTPGQLCGHISKIFAGGQMEDKKGLTMHKEEKAIPKKDSRDQHVLLIEDQAEIADMYKMRLENDGFDVLVANNGAWGLKLAQEKKFDIIVMDVMMPAMSGLDMLKKLKIESANKETPVIVLSNSVQDKDIDEAKATGAVDYLLKSKITPGKLIDEIEKYIK